MHLNWLLVLGNALVPIFMGFIWYNPRVFGNVWMRAAGFTPEMMRGGRLVFEMSATPNKAFGRDPKDRPGAK